MLPIYIQPTSHGYHFVGFQQKDGAVTCARWGTIGQACVCNGIPKSHNLRTNVPTHEHGTYSDDYCTTRQRFTVILHNTRAGVGARGHARQTQKNAAVVQGVVSESWSTSEQPDIHTML